MPTRLSRAQVPVDSTWDLADLFADEAAWEVAFQAVDEACLALARHQGHLGDSAAALLATVFVGLAATPLAAADDLAQAELGGGADAPALQLAQR